MLLYKKSSASCLADANLSSSVVWAFESDALPNTDSKTIKYKKTKGFKSKDIVIRVKIHFFARMKTTLVARAVDGLPLAASMDNEEQDLTSWKNQAKQILKRLQTGNSEQRCSIESGPFIFQ